MSFEMLGQSEPTYPLGVGFSFSKAKSGFLKGWGEGRHHMLASRASLVWTLALFFLSGATSLVYEVLWTRRLSLTFGHTVLAVSTVLTVFMTGLALGSFLAGRWSDGERARLSSTGDARGAGRFLALYGYLELFIGAWGVLSLFFLNGVESLYLAAARSGSEGAALYAIVFIGSFLVLLPPTTAMGATLPVFTQLLVVTKAAVGTWLSRIYGWNTLGACCGAAIGGFLLLPSLGLKLSVVGAALGNLVIGGVAVQAAKRMDFGSLASAPTEDDDQGGQKGGDHGSRLLPLAFGLSGFAAMVYQLGWTRGLILSMGSSTYSFSIILTAFLASLGLGSLIYKRTMGEAVPRIWHLGVLQFAIGLSGLLATYAIGRLPEVMVWAVPNLGHSFLKIMLFDFAIVMALMFLPTLAMGLTFPLVTHLYTERLASLGRRLGEAYAANTCGAIAGSFLGGFFLVPHFGAQKALLGAVVLNLLVGLVLAFVGNKVGEGAGPRAAMVATALLGFALVAFVPRWNPTELSAGAGIYANADHFLFQPAYYKDGVSATVTVGFNGPHAPYLKVNGKTDASLGQGDMAHQILLGLLPVTLHHQPKKVALVGLGSGVTAACLAAAKDVEKIRCAELEPAVVEVQKYFAPYVNKVAENQKLDLSVNDGRTFILGSPEKFDLIISQPSNPWIAGIGNLYTEDFYRACAEQLEDKGLMCQWINVYAVSKTDVEMVLATFFEVFPEGLLFQIGPGDLIIFGSSEALALDAERMQALWKEDSVAYWFQNIGLLTPDYLYGTFVASRKEVMDRFAGRPLPALNTDDRPLLEFRAPLSLYTRDPEVEGFSDTFSSLLPPGVQAKPETTVNALLGRMQVGRYLSTEKAIDEALKAQLPGAPLAGAILMQRLGDLQAAEGLLRALSPAFADKISTQIQLGNMRSIAEQWSTALLHYQRALEDPLPGSSYSLFMKAGLAAESSGDSELALEYYRKAAELTERPDPLAEIGSIQFDTQGNLEESKAAYEEALRRDPYDYISHFGLALLASREDELDVALEHALASYRLFPETRLNVELIADVYMRQGRDDLAGEFIKEALELRQREADLNLKAR